MILRGCLSVMVIENDCGIFSLVTTAVPSEGKDTIGYIVGTVVSVILAAIILIIAGCWYVYQSFMQVLNVVI